MAYGMTMFSSTVIVIIARELPVFAFITLSDAIPFPSIYYARHRASERDAERSMHSSGGLRSWA